MGLKYEFRVKPDDKILNIEICSPWSVCMFWARWTLGNRKNIHLVLSGFKTSLRLKINCRNSLKAVCRLVAANAEMGPKLHKIVWYVFMSFSFDKLLSTETIVTGWVRSLDSGLLYPPYRCELASLMVWRCLWGRTELPPLPPASGPELQHLLWSSSQVLWVQKSIKLEECFHMGKLWVT